MASYSLNQIIEQFIPLFYALAALFIFLLSFNLLKESYIKYKRSKFLKNVEWKFFELRFSRENTKGAKAMEQVFASLFGIYSFGIPWMMKLKGVVDLWISFEIVGTSDGIRFYARVPAQYVNLFEASLYAQYPNLEIIPVEDDYVFMFGKRLPNESFDLWGTGFTLVKSSVYPIKTYKEFEEAREEKSLDPLSTIFEAMSKLRDNETVFIQMMFSPTGPATGRDIKKMAEEEIKDIMEKKAITRKNKEGEEEKMVGMMALTPGDQEVVKAIERKASKMVFETVLRFIYIDKREGFNGKNISSVMGAFQQFNSPQLNSLRPDSTITIFGGWKAMLFPKYKKAKINIKKRKLFYHYATRRFGIYNRLKEEKLPIFNTEELATLYHFPQGEASAPGLKKPFAKKGVAPANLPVAEK